MANIFLTAGNDTYTSNSSVDTIFAGAGDDIIDAAPNGGVNTVLTAYGEGGNDRLTGQATGNTNDYLSGDAGDDILIGNGGADSLVGGIGSDFLSGGSGNDTLYSHDTNQSDFIVERDDFYFGTGANTAVLRSDYLGGTQSINPNVDSSHVRIYDWNSLDGNEQIDVKYATSSYGIMTSTNWTGGAAADAAIYYNNGGVNNLVAIVVDSTAVSII